LKTPHEDERIISSSFVIYSTCIENREILGERQGKKKLNFMWGFACAVFNGI
jgi:hypothetical protein